VLDCTICFEPLQPPLYQVVNSPSRTTCVAWFLVLSRIEHIGCLFLLVCSTVVIDGDKRPGDLNG
jgi:hypothetical protein